MEELDVDVDANPLEVIQGKVNSVSIKGKAFGKIELNQPTDATARFVLTEQTVKKKRIIEKT